MSSKQRETTVEERNIVIKLHKEGKSLQAIGSILGKSHATIQYIVNKYKNSKSIQNKHCSGRPSKLNERDERFILRRVKYNVFENAPSIATQLEIATGKSISL